MGRFNGGVQIISMAKKLNNQEQIFIDEYLVRLDPEKAALVAKYAATTAHSKAYLWVSNSKNNPKPYIAKAIRKELAKRTKKAGVTGQRVIDELAKIGFANIKDFITEGNEIKDISKLKRQITAVVESVQVDIRHDGGDSEGYTEKVRLKFHDKLKALENLGKHLGIYEKDNRQQAQTLAEFLKAMKDD